MSDGGHEVTNSVYDDFTYSGNFFATAVKDISLNGRPSVDDPDTVFPIAEPAGLTALFP